MIFLTLSCLGILIGFSLKASFNFFQHSYDSWNLPILILFTKQLFKYLLSSTNQINYYNLNCDPIKSAILTMTISYLVSFSCPRHHCCPRHLSSSGLLCSGPPSFSYDLSSGENVYCKIGVTMTVLLFYQPTHLRI